jgi:hypothetical protein
MTTKKLTFRQKILVAGTLFGMFFGAGNLIFPVHLGQMAGRNAVVAMIGFIITAVGIPIFGVAAIGITHSDGLQTLSSKVGKGTTFRVTLDLPAAADDAETEEHTETAKHLPIIALTANAYHEDIQKCLAAGMNAHLSKPINIDRAVRTIQGRKRICG